MKIRVLGAHHLESSTSRLTSLLVDGVVALDAGSLSSGLTLEEQGRVRGVLVTHRHFDHSKDLPLIGLAIAKRATIEVFGTKETLDFLASHLFDGEIYPDFTKWPAEKPAFRLRPIEPLREFEVAGLDVMAVPVPHGDMPAVGYRVARKGAGEFFFTGDTGGGLAPCWEHASPRLLATEVSLPDAEEALARRAGHLTPSLLGAELAGFRQLKGYLPRVLAVHLSPVHERELTTGLARIGKDLSAEIIIGRQGLELEV